MEGQLQKLASLPDTCSSERRQILFDLSEVDVLSYRYARHFCLLKTVVYNYSYFVSSSFCYRENHPFLSNTDHSTPNANLELKIYNWHLDWHSDKLKFGNLGNNIRSKYWVWKRALQNQSEDMVSFLQFTPFNMTLVGLQEKSYKTDSTHLILWLPSDEMTDISFKLLNFSFHRIHKIPTGSG